MLSRFVKSAKIAVFAAFAISLMPAVANAAPADLPTASTVVDDPGILASVTCTNGRLCVYKDTNFNGLARRFTVGENDYDTVNWWNYATNRETSDGMDNDASSVINKTNGWVRLYRDEGYNGLVICMGKQSSVKRLSRFTFDFPLNRTMDNRVSAHSMSRTDGCDFRVEPGQNL